MSKLKALSTLKTIAAKLRKRKRTIAFTNGCFDILHPGHIEIFKQAKKRGDVLIVGLNSDSSVKKIKGSNRPILDQKSRTELLSALELIDYIVIFNEPTPLKVIAELKPDILIKGGDWKRSEIVGVKIAKKVLRVKLKKGHSTTRIINKIKRSA